MVKAETDRFVRFRDSRYPIVDPSGSWTMPGRASPGRAPMARPWGGGWRCGMYPCSRRPVVRLEGWASGLRSGGCSHCCHRRRGGVECSLPAARAARGSAQAPPCGRAPRAKCAGRAWWVWSRLWLPTQARPNRHARSVELPSQSPGVHTELLGNDGERRALPVACRRPGDRVLGHLAGGASPFDACSIQVGDDRGPVHLVLTSEGIDRRTLAVEVAQVTDLSVG